MKTAVRMTVAIAASTITAQAAAGDLGTYYRYDFEITVTENDFAGSLGVLDVGTVGRLSYFVDPDPDAFDFSDDITRFYRVLGIELDIGGFQAAGNSGSYPSPTFVEGFVVSNDQPFATGSRPPSTYTDLLQSILFWDNPEYDFSVMNILEEHQASEPLPEFLTSLDLPLSLDLSRATTNALFIRSVNDSRTEIRFEFTDVDITVVPTPGAAGLLVFSGLVAARRRR